jgi:glycosyltransferase involved in cell wall biosynthesis
VHIATEGPLGWAALKVARSLGIPVTSTFHTNFHRYCAHYRLGWLRGVVTRHLRQFHNQSVFTMVPNAVLRQTLQQEGYRDVVVLGRGVDTRLFNPARRNPALRATWGVAEQDPVVIYVGRLAPEKSLHTIEAAFQQIEQRNARARMVWVGDGPESEKLQRRHPRHIFTGPKLGQALAEHYASADLFLFPSMTETYGNVVPEAMASGLAVVAYDYAAATLHVKPGQNGVLVPFGDEQGFIRQAVDLAAQPQLVSEYGRKASDSVVLHSWEAVCGQFDEYLSAAVQGGRDV